MIEFLGICKNVICFVNNHLSLVISSVNAIFQDGRNGRNKKFKLTRKFYFNFYKIYIFI